jgi:hypothetical protein
VEQNQQQSQQQWQGAERRQSLGPYQGADRRQQPPYAPVKEPSPDDGTRPLSTQERKDEQEERARQQQKDQSDIH